MTLKTIEQIASKRISDSKRSAKKKKIKHTLKNEDIIRMHIQSGGKCPITGNNFILDTGNLMVPSLDRFNSKKGYTPDNCWLISWAANRAKGEMEWDEFKNFIKSSNKNMESYV